MIDASSFSAALAKLELERAAAIERRRELDRTFADPPPELAILADAEVRVTEAAIAAAHNLLAALTKAIGTAVIPAQMQ